MSAVPVLWVNVVPARHVLVRLANLAAVHCRDGAAGDPLDITANVAVHTREDGTITLDARTQGSPITAGLR